MPNVAAALGLGVFMMVPGTLGRRAAEVEALFALTGDVVEIDEALFDAATALAGCMPGMLAYFVEAFAAAGVAHGLAEDVAARLAVAGVHGAAAIIAHGGDPAARRRSDAGRHDCGSRRETRATRPGADDRRRGGCRHRARPATRMTGRHEMRHVMTTIRGAGCDRERGTA
jgi:pyrroline-5-carboxylate reductase